MFRKFAFVINKIVGSVFPYKIRRAIADFPGVLKINELLFGNLRTTSLTPEGYELSINPLFHGQLSSAQKILDYEPEMREVLNRITKPGMIAYDIGANVGIFSLQLSNLVGKKGKVYAFEPEMNNFKLLADTISRNNISNTFSFPKAVGQHEGVMSFDRRGGSFSGRIVDGDEKYKTSHNITDVETVSLDLWVSNNIISPPDVIKIDVEGFELKVVLGMLELLSEHDPIIVCEVHQHLDDPLENIIHLLNARGYSLYKIEDFIAGALREITTFHGVGKFVAMKPRPTGRR